MGAGEAGRWEHDVCEITGSFMQSGDEIGILGRSSPGLAKISASEERLARYLGFLGVQDTRNQLACCCSTSTGRMAKWNCSVIRQWVVALAIQSSKSLEHPNV